jgi:hypothetical protein
MIILSPGFTEAAGTAWSLRAAQDDDSGRGLSTS